MTAHFAIPATTFVLRAVLQQRVDLAYGSFPAPLVSVEPPPRPPATVANGAAAPQSEAAGLYLFMHHAGPNPAWRNMFEPHVGSDGLRHGPSPLALDLHYLLAATGSDLEREALLGLGVTALTRHGIVPRALIRSILTAISVPTPPVKFLDSLPNEPLGDPAHQPEQITVSQASVDVDLSTKIWSALQSPMRPCAHFLVTTVFLDVDETLPAGKPVDVLHVGVRPDPTRDTTLPEDTVTVVESPHG